MNPEINNLTIVFLFEKYLQAFGNVQNSFRLHLIDQQLGAYSLLDSASQPEIQHASVMYHARRPPS